MRIGIRDIIPEATVEYDPLHIEVQLALANEALNDAFRTCDKLSQLCDNLTDIRRVAKRYKASSEAMQVLDTLLGNEFVTYSVEGLWGKIKEMFVGIWNAIKKFFSWIWNKIKSLFGKGNKLPNTPEMQALAKDNPELQNLIDPKMNESRYVGLSAIKSFLQIMGNKANAQQKKPVALCKIDALSKIAGDISGAFVQWANNDIPSAVSSMDLANISSDQLNSFETKMREKVNELANKLEPPAVKVAIATGKTDGLAELFSGKAYTDNVSKPETVIQFIDRSQQLSSSMTKTINEVNNGMKSLQKELINRFATDASGTSDGAKEEGIAKIVQAACGQARRFLGVLQGLYTVIAKNEQQLSESMPIFEGWYSDTKAAAKKRAESEEE